MNKKTRTLLISMITACLCLALIIGATFALFSDVFSVNNHLAAGNLEVGLKRVSYQECVLNAEGELVTGEKDTTEINLVKDSSELFKVTKAVPGSWYEAEIGVENLGSVAFDYGVRIIWDGENASAGGLALAGQLQITITQNGEQKAKFMLDEAEDTDLSFIAANGAEQTFTVRSEFTDDAANHDAQSAELTFDLQVYATQSTGGQASD